MRAQDGCFLFFPFSNIDDENDYLDLIKFNRKFSEHIEEKNKIENTNLAKTFLAHMDIDKESKKSILNELDKMYGITKKLIFVEIDNITESINYYKNLFIQSELKTKRLIEQYHK